MNYNKLIKKVEFKSLLRNISSNDNLLTHISTKKKTPKIINNFLPIFPKLKQNIGIIKSKYEYINYTTKANALENINNIKKKYFTPKPRELRIENPNKLSIFTTEYTNNENTKWNSNLQLSRQNDILYSTSSKKSLQIDIEKNDKEKEDIRNKMGRTVPLFQKSDEKKNITRRNKRNFFYYYPTSSKDKFNRIKTQTNLLLGKMKENPSKVKDLQNRINTLIKAKKYLYKEGIGKDYPQEKSHESSKSSESSDSNLGFKGIKPIIKNDYIYDNIQSESNYDLSRYTSLTKPSLIKPSTKPKLNVISYSNLNRFEI